jgi:hypothetical protein
MGFEDQVADTGAELTNLKKKEEPLYTEPEASPWMAELLADKKNEERLGYEPVQYAVKGAEPAVGTGEPKVDFLAPKKFGGSGMARNVVEEPVGEKMPIFALKPTKPEVVLQKNSSESYSQVGSFGSGEHTFVNKKLSPEQAIIDKKLASTQSTEAQYTPTLTKSEGKFGFANAGWQSAPASQALDDWSAPVKFKVAQGSEGQNMVKLKSDLNGEVFPAAGAQSGGSFPLEKGVVKEMSGSSSSTFPPTAAGSPVVGSPGAERVWAGGSEKVNSTLEEKFAPVQSGSTSFASSLQQAEPTGIRKLDVPTVQTQIPLSSEKQGGAIFQSKAEPSIQQTQKQLALSEPKQIGAVQQQLAATDSQKFEPVKEKVGPTINQQFGAPVRLTAPIDGKVALAAPIVKQEQVSTPMRTQTLAQQNTFKLDQTAPRGEQAVNRAATAKDLSVAARTDLHTATTGNGASGSSLAIRQSEVAPSLVKKLTQGAESGTQFGLSRTAMEQALPGKKLVAENTSLTELPSKFSKTTPLTQIEKLTADTQLRSQADRITASSQLKALADQSNVKLKGEIATTGFKQTDHIAAVRTGQQQLENGLQPRITPVKAAQQQLESGLQPRVTPVKAAQQQLENGLQPRIAPLTGKTTQDLVAALKPQERVVANHQQNTDLPAANDRRIAASTIRNGAEALSTPYTIDRATRMGNAHVVSGDVKALSGRPGVTNNNEVHAGDKKVAPAGDKKTAPAGQIAALLNNVKDGKGDISRALSFEHLMSSPVKSTQDRYVGGEFLLASMIIAAGAARRMPEQKAEGQASNSGARATQVTAEVAQGKHGDKNAVAAQSTLDNSANSGKNVKASPFSQVVDIIARGFTAGRTSEQTQAIEASRRATFNQGQSDSVRYITGVELAILLAAGGVTRLRSDKIEGRSDLKDQSKEQSKVQSQDDTALKHTKVSSAHTINFNNVKQPLNAGADTHATTRIVANMSGQRADFTLPNAQTQIPNQIQPQRVTDVSGAATKGDKAMAQPSNLSVRGERCIPGADVAIAAMLMLGGVTRKRNGESIPAFPANPNELAEKVDRPFRLDRRLGEIVAQAKSFVAREPMPVSGLRATCANLVATGDVIVPAQYKQGSQEPKVENQQTVQHFATPGVHDNSAGKQSAQEFAEALMAPTGWVHETLRSKEMVEGASEEKLKKVEQDQQESAGKGAASTLYRPIWIIAPGETFVSIAEDHFGDGAIAWLIADLNKGKFTDSSVEGKRVIEIQSRQRIELPVASDIEAFRHNRQRHEDAENIITIVTASQLDIELKQASFQQFLGTLQTHMHVPGMAVLPQLDLITPQKPVRAMAPFGMSAPQFASIAAAVSLPLIVPQLDMVQQSADANTVHVQELRSEPAKPEESL